MVQRKLIYIGGWGRSGSSVLANILGSHHDAASVGEVRYIWDRGIIADKRCGCGESFSNCEFWSRVANSAPLRTEPTLADRRTRRVGSQATFEQIISMLTGNIARYRRNRADDLDVLRRLYRAAADTAAVSTLVDASKTPSYAINLIGDPDVDLYFIHLIRDPRAVAYSWSRKRASGETVDELLPRYGVLKCATYWIVFNLLAMWFRTKDNTHYLTIRYEDFCEQPRRTIDKILIHCGLSTSGLRWHFADVAEVEPQHSISGNPSRFDVGSLRILPDVAWQTKMSAWNRWVVTALCAPLLPLFGYRLLPDKEGAYYKSQIG